MKRCFTGPIYLSGKSEPTASCGAALPILRKRTSLQPSSGQELPEMTSFMQYAPFVTLTSRHERMDIIRC